MKKNLILIICFLDVTFPSTENSNEKTLFYSPTVLIQKQKPNSLISPPGGGQNEKAQRMFYRMSSINSNCLKNLHNQFRNKNRSEYRRPFGMVKPLRMSTFRNDGNDQQSPFLYRTRQNLLQERQSTRRPFERDRIIFMPPYVKSSEKRMNFFQNANGFKINKTAQSNSNGGSLNQKLKKVTNETVQEIWVEEKPKRKEENVKLIKTSSSKEASRETEKQHTIENSTVFDDVHVVSKTVKPSSYKTSEITQNFKGIKSKTETYSEISPQNFWYQKKPTQTQPYEVEEIIEEELSVDLDNEKADNFKNNPFDRPALLAKEIKRVTNLENGQKMNGIQGLMGSSINTVIKTLMSPMMKVLPTVANNRDTFTKEKVQNRPVFKDYFTSTLPQFITLSGQRPPNFRKITNSSRSSPNRYQQSKHLKMKNYQINERFQNWTRKATKSTAEPKKIISELNSDLRINMMPPLKAEYSKNVHTTDTTEILPTPLSTPKTEKNILNVQQNTLQKTATVTEIENISLLSSEPVFRGQISVTPLETQKILKGFTTQQTLSSKTKKPTTASLKTQTIFKKIVSPPELTTVKITQSTDLLSEFTENFTEEAKTSPKVQYVKTDKSPSEITVNKLDLTAPSFQGFTNHPSTFDLITTLKYDFKKNQDAMGKNGRKMHFRYEPTTSNLITELGSTGPRRSDILITENFNDYVDVDNNLSTLNYLDKLKQNNSFSPRNSLLHPTFNESIIPLIPVVINDLREGIISPKDVSILSRAFGKYWSAIEALANVTNLDMLPLIKMKNEKDWNNIWQSFLPEATENTELTIVKTTKTYSKQESDDYSSYDYLAEYKDFYEYVFQSEKEEKEKKRKKARIKRDEEDNLKKSEEFREYSESTEEEEEEGFTTGNMYEDMFFVKTLEDKNASGLNRN